MTIKRSTIAGSLVVLFALTAVQTSVQSKNGCPALLGDSRFTAVAQLNNGTLSGELGRGVRGRKVSGLGPSGDEEALLVVAATSPPAHPRAFVIPLDFSSSAVSFPLTISVPAGTDYSRVEIGNINGDPWPDVVVASAAVQKAWIFPGVLNSNDELVYSSTPDLQLAPPSGVATSRFGAALACGNLQGSSSSTEEIVISDNISGKVFIFEFNGSGFTATTLTSPVSGDGFGKSLAVGDVTGSADQDLIVGANNRSKGSISGAGAVVVYPGPNFSGPLSPLTLTASNARRNDSLGQGVTGGDMHGGSFPDVIASTWDDGRAQVFTGLVTDGQSAPLAGSLTDFTLTPAPGYGGGWSTTGLQSSDINSDGRMDIFVGAPNASVCGQQPSAGAIHIFLSQPGPAETQPERLSIQSAGGAQSKWLAFGWSVSPVPGTNLFVVGEPGREFNGTRKGQVYVYRYEP